MKRIWTKGKALKWIADVESEKAPKGLKYCSALDFLNIRKGAKNGK